MRCRHQCAEVMFNQEDNSFSNQVHVLVGIHQVRQMPNDGRWTPARSMTMFEDIALAGLKNCNDAFRFGVVLPFPNKNLSLGKSCSSPCKSFTKVFYLNCSAIRNNTIAFDPYGKNLLRQTDHACFNIIPFQN